MKSRVKIQCNRNQAACGGRFTAAHPTSRAAVRNLVYSMIVYIEVVSTIETVSDCRVGDMNGNATDLSEYLRVVQEWKA